MELGVSRTFELSPKRHLHNLVLVLVEQVFTKSPADPEHLVGQRSAGGLAHALIHEPTSVPTFSQDWHKVVEEVGEFNESKIKKK